MIIKQNHTFTSNILFEQRRFGLGCPSLYQVKWQEENEKPTNIKLLFFASRTNWKIYVVRRGGDAKTKVLSLDVNARG